MKLQTLAHNGMTIRMPADGYRLNPAAVALLARYDRGHYRTRIYLLCTHGGDHQLYLLDMIGMLRRLVDLRSTGYEPVIPLDEVVADFTIPIRR